MELWAFRSASGVLFSSQEHSFELFEGPCAPGCSRTPMKGLLSSYLASWKGCLESLRIAPFVKRNWVPKNGVLRDGVEGNLKISQDKGLKTFHIQHRSKLGWTLSAFGALSGKSRNFHATGYRDWRLQAESRTFSAMILHDTRSGTGLNWGGSKPRVANICCILPIVSGHAQPMGRTGVPVTWGMPLPLGTF